MSNPGWATILTIHVDYTGSDSCFREQMYPFYIQFTAGNCLTITLRRYKKMLNWLKSKTLLYQWQVNRRHYKHDHLMCGVIFYWVLQAITRTCLLAIWQMKDGKFWSDNIHKMRATRIKTILKKSKNSEQIWSKWGTRIEIMLPMSKSIATKMNQNELKWNDHDVGVKTKWWNILY